MKNRSKVIILEVKPSIFKEVFEDIVSLNWGNFSKNNVIIVLLLEFIRKGVVSLVDLNKLLVSSLIIRIIFRVILNCKFPVGILDVIKSGRLRNSEDLIIVAERIWEVFIKEFFF